MKQIKLGFIELLETSSAPSTGLTMGVPVNSLIAANYDLTYLPEIGVVSATMLRVTGSVPATEMLYPCSNIRSMCVLPDQPDEQPESVPPPSSKRHKVKIEAEPEELPAYMREMK